MLPDVPVTLLEPVMLAAVLDMPTDAVAEGGAVEAFTPDPESDNIAPVVYQS